ncbi:MAG: tRNA glutamyl-Q(34) synthetase GluQRS [Amphiplicatus sp.]
MPNFITRFAPSPTGLLHLGHAFSALTAAEAAKKAGGKFLLRIEDIDRTRCRSDYEQAIYDDLAWLGLDWETPVRRQSDHFADYAAVLQRMIDEGLVYRCFKTRAEILDEIARAPHLSPEGAEGPAYIGAPLAAHEERSLLAEGAPFAWRLSIAAARARLGATLDGLTLTEEAPDPGHKRRTINVRADLFGDVILARKDSGTSYHLASTHDDALQGVTHVIRGDDLRPAAHVHRLLQALLDWPAALYRHHPLLTDETGKRLAKRDKAATLKSLREAGETPESVRARLGFA